MCHRAQGFEPPDDAPLVAALHNQEIRRSAEGVRFGGGEEIFRFEDPHELFLAVMVSGLARVY